MRLAKIKIEELLQRAFITGLLGETSKQLRAQVKIFEINLQDVLNHARLLLSEVTKEECVSTTIFGNYKSINSSF